MFKVLVASEGTTISPAVFEFVKQMNGYTPVLLSGMFLPGHHFMDLLMPDTPPVQELLCNEEMHRELVAVVHGFIRFCKSNNICYTLYSDRGWLEFPELKQETRYADLLVLGAELLATGNTGGWPGRHLASLVGSCECPVIVIPETYTTPARNIIAFDGSAAAVYALKQFSYLLPGFASNETVVVAADNDTIRKASAFRERRLRELAESHYPSYRIESEVENVLRYFSGEMNAEGTMIVTGSYIMIPGSGTASGNLAPDIYCRQTSLFITTGA